MIENLTFDQLPKAVTMLTNEISELKKLLLENREQLTIEQPEKFLNIQEASKFLNLAVATVYSKVSRKELPCMKRGKRLYFSNTELINYIQEGRKKSKAELQDEADTYLFNTKKALKS
jgi:excisionase family DNA binding protein